MSTADRTPTSRKQDDQLIFEIPPSRVAWVVMLLGALGFGAIFVGQLLHSPLDRIGVTLFVAVASLGLGLLACLGFQQRNESKRFYGDRVELLRSGRCIQTLPYAQVDQVAYGFRGDLDHLLEFSGPDKNPSIALHVVGKDKADPTALTISKLVALRDVLYDVVAARLVKDAASQPDGAAWFGNVRLHKDGIHYKGDLNRWVSITIDANQNTGGFTVRGGGGKVLGRTSMIYANVVAGWQAAEYLQARAAAPSARASTPKPPRSAT